MIPKKDPIAQAEELLFSRWRNQLAEQKKIFIPDGVVDPERWRKAKIKVLFLLKEVNGGETEWDERDYLKKYNEEQRYIETHSPTITALIQWVHAVLCDEELNWDTILKETQALDTQSMLLEQIALVNVKKVPGGGTVDGEKFDAYWKNSENIKSLKEQLSIYASSDVSPDVIVCGATSWYYNEVFKEERLQWETTWRGIPFCKHGKTIVVDFCHPQARISSNIKYYALFDALMEIRSKSIPNT